MIFELSFNFFQLDGEIIFFVAKINAHLCLYGWAFGTQMLKTAYQITKYSVFWNRIKLNVGI
ncbi:MAG TPA: hypothetical protein DEV81_12105 [Cyanobacteria bacterium UBA11049]|nr:hypothetical protein [Cyanobacteria bacterium UBA11049]